MDIENLDKEAEKILVLKSLQEMRMLYRSLSDCKSLLLNVMIQVLQFVSNCQLCQLCDVTKSLSL